jgi:uncharacterized protein (TIGR03435 family)
MLQMQHILGVALFAAGLQAQTFEVASVKAVPNGTGRFTMTGGPGTSDPGRIAYMNIPLRRVLLAAYDLANYQIVGPDWLNTLRYDITATVPAGTTKEQFQAMLRDLLAKRFGMVMRRESREMSIYAMLPGRNGTKLRAIESDAKPLEAGGQLGEVKPNVGRDGFPEVKLAASGIVIETQNGRARVTANAVPMAKFAEFLSGRLDRPVLDRTGLAGIFSFNVYFRPDGADGGDAMDPGILVAVQEQLGLRLDATRGAVDLLVIDHAEKVPVEN